MVRDTAISFEFAPPDEQEMADRIARITATDPWLVMERNGELAGYAYASSFRNRPAYATTRETTVYVHADHQRAGVARSLMTELLADLRRRGVHRAIAVIALPNDASVALHESLGFRQVGTLHEIARKFDMWHDEALWEVALSPG